MYHFSIERTQYRSRWNELEKKKLRNSVFFFVLNMGWFHPTVNPFLNFWFDIIVFRLVLLRYWSLPRYVFFPSCVDDMITASAFNSVGKDIHQWSNNFISLLGITILHQKFDSISMFLWYQHSHGMLENPSETESLLIGNPYRDENNLFVNWCPTRKGQQMKTFVVWMWRHITPNHLWT